MNSRASEPPTFRHMSDVFVLKPIEGHFRAVFSPTRTTTSSISDVAAYVAAALRRSYAAEPKLLFLASCFNTVTVITSDQALSETIRQKGIALALRLCTPPSVVSRLRIANVGGIHASHLREMLSAFGEVKSLRMLASLDRGSDPVYGTAALATMIASTAIPSSVVCDRDGLRLTVTISASTFASAARRPDDGKLAQLSPPGEDQEHAELPLSPAAPARVACRDWARAACKRGTACRFAHATLPPGLAAQLPPPGADAKEQADHQLPPAVPGRVACRDWARAACKRGAACRFSHANSPPERPALTGAPGPLVHPQRRANVDAASAAAAPAGAAEPCAAEAGWLPVPQRQRKRHRGSPAVAQSHSADRALGSAQAKVDSTPKQLNAGPHDPAGPGPTPSKRHAAAPLQDAELEDGELADDDDASSCLTPTASAPGPATRVPDVTETRPRPDVFDSTCGYEGEGPPKLRPPGRPSQGQLSQLPGAALASRSRSASVESESGFCTQLACSSSSAPPSSSAPFAICLPLRPFCRLPTLCSEALGLSPGAGHAGW